MTTTIALAGKGGTGKTTVSALLIKHLIERNAGTILAIDADPSTNLNLALGLAMDATIGDIREEMLAQVNKLTGAVKGNAGMNKFDYLDYQIEYALVEGRHVDLLAMGRPEGPGCYCAVNHILRDILDRLGRSYDYVIVDNEAGLEHLSRRTTRDVDVLLIVTDPTMRGVVAAGRVASMSRELDVNIRQAYLVINRVLGELPPALQQSVDSLGVPLAGTIPADAEVVALDAEGRPLVEISDGSPVYQAVRAIAEKTLAATALPVS
jgi:CO dehydrogenase maturation factor